MPNKNMFAHAAVAVLPELHKDLHTHVGAVLLLRHHNAHKAECVWFSLFGDGPLIADLPSTAPTDRKVDDRLYQVVDFFPLTWIPNFLRRRLPLVYLGQGRYLRKLPTIAKMRTRLREAWRSDIYRG